MNARQIITVTDHAVLRYMERVMGFNVEAVRTLILADGREQMMQMAKTANIPMGNKNYAILRDYIVCTIRPKGGYAPITSKTGGKLRVPRL